MQNLLRAIEARRTIALDRFIYALGIRRVGETNAKLLARHYGTYANWRAQMLAATTIGSEERSALGSIIGVGPALAEELADFFTEPRNLAVLDDLEAELTIEPADGVTLGAGRRSARIQALATGGTVGLILDARGIPIVLPRRGDDRRAIVASWRDALAREPASGVERVA